MTTLLTRTPDRATTLPQQQPAPPAADPTAPARAAAPVTPPVAPPAPPAVRQLVLSGALARADSSWLEPQLEELVATGARTVEVDLSGVEAMDGSIARLLLRTSWHLGDPARALLLLHPQPVVRRVLRFYGAGGLVVR